MFSKDYFLGLDIGTDSIGWSVTDAYYKILKYKGNAMWGVSLFEQAEQAAERRSFRTTRRRTDRRKQRILLLQELMLPAIVPVDEKFFLRLKESALWNDDKTNGSKFAVFADKNYTDREYHLQYPTVHHLISELMNNKEPHDIRFIYIACAYLLAHRGHFLNEIDKDSIDKVLDIKNLYNEFMNWFDSCEEQRPFDCTAEKFGEILKNNSGIKKREEAFYNLLWNGKKPKNDSAERIDKASVIILISGGTVKLYALFGENEYKNLEQDKISLSDSDFEEKFLSISSEISSDDAGLLKVCKGLYDWALLVNVLSGEKNISAAKIKIYEKHKSDLRLLKRLVKKYIPDKYEEVFKNTSADINNYARYSGNTQSVREAEISKYSKCTAELFCAYIRKLFAKITPDSSDAAEFDDMMSRLSENKFCPKQVNTDNRVIPYQLNYYELKVILNNASAYIPYLRQSDEYGTIADKILSIMLFKIPYYVGPLVNSSKNNNAWLQRKAEGRILPWNFDEMVDKEKCENEFIRRMTGKCTYIAGEDVLPKNSLLYSKYSVLNEINNIRINSEKITADVKQKIFRDLFMQKRRVTVKDIKNLLVSEGIMTTDSQIEGLDKSVKSSLKSYHDFKKMISTGTLTEQQTEEIILHMTITTDRQRLKNWLKNYPLSDEDIRYISSLNYSEFGRLSKRLLTGIADADTQTGEIINPNIITMMWETNYNLTELLSKKFGYSSQIEEITKEYYSEKQQSLDDRLNNMYVSNAVKRPIIRSLEIVKEINKIMGHPPKRIFIEVARDHTGKDKGKRTSSRRNQILEFFKGFPASETEELKKQLEKKSDSQLRSDKLFLYFMQLGKCMYSGESIVLETLGTKLYDIDHIYPRSKAKDDSLDNRVLVLSDINGRKKDVYPIEKEIRDTMHGVWASLLQRKLISETKFSRLIRSKPFTDDELSGFISRQLVETRQSSKAVSVLLKEMFPESEIVHVKAGIVSDFRNDFKMLKCREVNDLHHAKDAYLNIVIGNVYHIKFTKNPSVFIKEYREGKSLYSMKLTSLLNHDISRNGEVAWLGNGTTLAKVKNQMMKNNIRYVRYCFTRKGGLFNQLPEKKNPMLVNRKSNLPAEKYGGYNSTTAACFLLIKFFTKKSDGIAIMPVELMYLNRFKNDTVFAEKYIKDILSSIVTLKRNDCIERISLPLDKRKCFLKINTMLDIDGLRVNIKSKSNKGKRINIGNASSLILNDDDYKYCKRLSAVNELLISGKHTISSEFDKITCERNIELYDVLTEKAAVSPYCSKFADIHKTFFNGKQLFEKLSAEEQVHTLINMLSVFKTGRSTECNLKAIGGPSNAAKFGYSSVLNNIKGAKSIRIVDQSATGLYEKISPNLLEL